MILILSQFNSDCSLDKECLVVKEKKWREEEVEKDHTIKSVKGEMESGE